jgi:hypothetical protein
VSGFASWIMMVFYFTGNNAVGSYTKRVSSCTISLINAMQCFASSLRGRRCLPVYLVERARIFEATFPHFVDYALGVLAILAKRPGLHTDDRSPSYACLVLTREPELATRPKLA